MNDQPASDKHVPGQLDVLSTGRGHMSLNFNADDPKDVEKARKTVEDMLKRGYAIFADTGDGEMKRVTKFDPKTDTYEIRETPTGNKKATKKADAKKSHTTAVAPTAGG